MVLFTFKSRTNEFSSLFLQVLCLNFNHIESIVGKPKASQAPSSPSQTKGIIDITNPEFNTPVLDKLQVLHLGFVVLVSFLHFNVKTPFKPSSLIGPSPKIEELRLRR